ncbi:MAG: 30S ribosomal protein S16 [Elusimicrobiota bacterium]
MVAIRLTRVGRRNVARFRLVAVDSSKSAKASPLEYLGAYDPTSKNESKLTGVKKERVEHWMKHGAQVSDTAKRLLTKAKVI